ncbi:MAG TPA: carboxypeptidase-like regulatory domain-containing protein [Mucilaginibacter sp.]|jgi:hypothetical protein|nr:carboxypeptidase-like regulatory domain-containing protein [Mucilaginibacter sp.]
MKKLIYILLLCVWFGANAQERPAANGGFSISGKVVDEKGEPMAGATVFLAASKKITSCNSEGIFHLAQVEPGNYDLVVRMIGYEPHGENVLVKDRSLTVNVKLAPNSTELAKIVVHALPDPNRAKYLALFIKNFIGETSNAAQCKILNPEVIYIHYDKESKLLEASSNDFIKIENKALGYTVNYLLTYFSFDYTNQMFSYEGKPYFEDLKDSAADKSKWDENRRIAYNGSIRHFFKALFKNTTEAEGFTLYKLPLTYKLPTDSVVITRDVPTMKVGSTPGGFMFHPGITTATVVKRDLALLHPIKSDSLFTVVSKNFKMLKLNMPGKNNPDPEKLFIVYSREPEPHAFAKSSGHIELPTRFGVEKSQVSHIIPTSDLIIFDKNGTLNPAQGIIVNGYWTWERVADLMPFDYE